MWKLLWVKLREALVSVFPVVGIVCVLYATPLLSLTPKELVVFLLCSAGLVLGIALFNLGADMAMTPMGEQVGAGLSRAGSMGLLVLVCFILGVLITVAEPDLTVLADQVLPDNAMLLIVTVGVGVGLFLVIAILKIVYHKELSSLLLFFYAVLFAAGALLMETGRGSFLAMAFDSGGVTTGPITVPFIMALGVGVALTLGGKNAGENSFGLVALCSVGPILAVMVLMLTSSQSGYDASGDEYAMAEDVLLELPHALGTVAGKVAMALGLIVVFFFVIQFIFLKLPRKRLAQIGVGILYTFVGLVVFLTAVEVGFMPVGYKIGVSLVAVHPAALTVAGFVLGLVVVLAEPAVHVLNRQVETVTDGTVSKRAMLIALSVGVGISLGLSMIRMIFDFSILYYLIPGYMLSLGLSFFVPGIYTAIAFDSGGVASGPLTSTFILPLAVGACMTLSGGDSMAVLENGFGIVAMVAMTPLITIQLLGFRSVMAQKVRQRIAMRRILDADDRQLIEFM